MNDWEKSERAEEMVILVRGCGYGRFLSKCRGDADKRVGRVDEKGTVYRTAPQDSDERVGEVNEDGSVFWHVPMVPDERLGQVDLKTGKLYRHRLLWPDEHVGWVDAQGSVYRRSRDDDEPDLRLGKVTGGRAYLEGAGAFFLLLAGTDD